MIRTECPVCRHRIVSRTSYPLYSSRIDNQRPQITGEAQMAELPSTGHPVPIAQPAPIAEAVHNIEALEVEVGTEASYVNQSSRADIDVAQYVDKSPARNGLPMLLGCDIDIASEVEVETEASTVNKLPTEPPPTVDAAQSFEPSTAIELPRAEIDAATPAEPPPNAQPAPTAEAASAIIPAQNVVITSK